MLENRQDEIIAALHVQPTVEVGKEIVRRIGFLKEYLVHSGMKGFVLGISGGQDSTLAGRLCQLAVEQLRKETGGDYVFVALRLPYGVQHDEADAQLAIQFIQPDKTYMINIQPAVDSGVIAFEQGTGQSMSDYNKGNQKAQERMTVQYRIAHQFQLLVVGTDHAAEAVTGFFTKYGDGGVDVTPLTGLTKRQGSQLLKELGADQRLYTKPPTADLLDQRPGQLDEDELQMHYQDIDNYLEGKRVSAEIARIIEQRYRVTQHKRHQPVTPFDVWWHH